MNCVARLVGGAWSHDHLLLKAPRGGLRVSFDSVCQTDTAAVNRWKAPGLESWNWTKNQRRRRPTERYLYDLILHVICIHYLIVSLEINICACGSNDNFTLQTRLINIISFLFPVESQTSSGETQTRENEPKHGEPEVSAAPETGKHLISFQLVHPTR